MEEFYEKAVKDRRKPGMSKSGRRGREEREQEGELEGEQEGELEGEPSEGDGIEMESAGTKAKTLPVSKGYAIGYE